MKNIRKTILIFITFWVGVFAVFSLVACQDAQLDKAKEKSGEKLKTEEKLKIEKAVSDMVIKYNAVEDWNGIFNEKDRSGSIYTIHIQEALLNTNGRPILFHAILDDIIRRNDIYIVSFEAFYNYQSIRFLLVSDEEQIKRLLKHIRLLDEFAIIASIEDVQKPVFTVTLNSEETEIEIESSDIVVATGKCLEFVHVGNMFSD